MTLVRQASLSHGRLTGEAEHAVPRGAHGHRHARHKRGPHLCNRQWGGQSPRHTRGWSAREGGTRWRDIHRPEERGSAANRWEAALRRGVAGDCRRWLHSASRLWIDCLDGGERALQSVQAMAKIGVRHALGVRGEGGEEGAQHAQHLTRGPRGVARMGCAC